MSGGSYFFAFRCTDEVAESLESGTDYYHNAQPSTPARLRFAAHLRLVALAMRAIEWEDSGDGDAEATEEAIARVFADAEKVTP